MEPSTKSPHHVDIHVGNRVQSLRKSKGHSQTHLGRAVGLTFQQIQKYESGVNRISASKLWDISTFLEVPISYFFEGLDGYEDHNDTLLSGLDEQTRRTVMAFIDSARATQSS